ncbi:MAG: HAD family phosphatase [Candidatus Peregrinibacteria bacterium]|nr:HAD family phosphatase [Candidatus Peregrinibacteria bacterium]MDZ4245359.1 HAD family phosphatase [Candidatus Gracilibacteria bacterium]
MKKKSFKALLFDADGTMYDSTMLHQKAYEKVCKELYDFDFSKQLYFDECVVEYKRPDQVLREQGIACNENELYRKKHEYYDTIARKELDATPGLVMLLQQAKAHEVPCVIVSGASHHTLENSLSILGLRDFFQFCIGYEDTVEFQKPHPYPYKKALKQLGITAEYGVAFEDTETGITSAKGAGLFCVAIKNNTNTREQLNKADLIISSYDELERTFDNQMMILGTQT